MDPADFDKAKLDPASVFDTPVDVLKARGLSVEDKQAILVRWEADAECVLFSFSDRPVQQAVGIWREDRRPATDS